MSKSAESKRANPRKPPTRPKTRAERRQASNRKASRKYRQSHKRQRPFLAFDGEGVNGRYVLLANGRSRLYRPKGIHTAEALAFLTRPECRRSINVWFAFGYDVAFILRDLPDDKLLSLYRGAEVVWRVYTLRYIPRKMLIIRVGGKRITHYDVFTFFNSSFVKACEKFLGEVDPLILEGKQARADFSTWQPERVEAYNRAELAALVELCERLREMTGQTLEGIPSLKISSWHGPGALASKVLRALEVGEHVFPERSYRPYLLDVFARAYFGGRVENFATGYTPATVYRYDVRSAYPAAMLTLPRLTWKWELVNRFHPEARLGVYHLKWDLRDFPAWLSHPGPLPHRDKAGYIVFRAEGEGWYWGPEVAAVLDIYPSVKICEGWVMGGPQVYPLAEAITRLYDMRARLKAANDPREYALKIALNSLYGKMCQKEGLSRYRSIAWAGYVTSHCRAAVLRAMLQQPDKILAVMTDGVLSTAPLDLPIGSGLGEWEVSEYPGAVILQPGIYALGDWEAGQGLLRWRGYNVPDFPLSQVLADCEQNGEARLPCPFFVSHPLAILDRTAYGPLRLQFAVQNRRLSPFVSHKRHFHIEAWREAGVWPNLRESSLPSRMMTLPPGLPPTFSAPYAPFSAPERERWQWDAMEEALAVKV